MQQLLLKKPVKKVWLAIAYIGLGEYDEAFKCLSNAYEQHEWNLIFIKDNFESDPLLSDPRFTAPLKKMGQSE